MGFLAPNELFQIQNLAGGLRHARLLRMPKRTARVEPAVWGALAEPTARDWRAITFSDGSLVVVAKDGHDVLVERVVSVV